MRRQPEKLRFVRLVEHLLHDGHDDLPCSVLGEARHCVLRWERHRRPCFHPGIPGMECVVLCWSSGPLAVAMSAVLPKPMPRPSWFRSRLQWGRPESLAACPCRVHIHSRGLAGPTGHGAHVGGHLIIMWWGRWQWSIQSTIRSAVISMSRAWRYATRTVVPGHQRFLECASFGP